MSSESDGKISPMMLQWKECKKSAKGAIVFFRLGDFYEAFEEDAFVVSKELDIVLTKRQEFPMSGFPAHACESYIDKLVAKGYRIAIAEQVEEASGAKGLVKREVVRIITPGSLIRSNLLSEKTNNFLVCLAQVNTLFGLAVIDLTTAHFRLLEFDNKQDLLNELHRIGPKEIIASEKCHKNIHLDIQQNLSCIYQVKDEWLFDHSSAYKTLVKHFKVHSLDAFGLRGMTAGINAGGALFSYITEELNISLLHVREIKSESASSFMSLDRATQSHLEIVQPLHEKGQTLLGLLDQTHTPMGGRLMRQWLLSPLLSVQAIQERQNLITLILTSKDLSFRLSSGLKEIKDLERLVMRIETGFANPRDLVGLKLSMKDLPQLSSCLQELSLEALPDLSELCQKIEKGIVETPPLRLSDGGVFKEGYNEDLDSLIALKTSSQTWVQEYQARLREQTQIKTLKVGYTSAFGYYIEVSRGQADKMPLEFQRRQTLVNAERFISPELKDYEYKILSAEGKIASLEAQLFFQLRQDIGSYAEQIRQAAHSIAKIDCILSLSAVARKHHYVQPIVDESDCLVIEEGRHPVIEASLKEETFIPNDVVLDQSKQRLLIITGPNMAGKSTYIRQVALIVIMAQIGSFVPAKKAHIGIIDKVFSRIGASDDLSRGQSTFMVEMTETANILNNVTDQSLVILDEIGRGTSTYDGISIAWSVAEFLLKTPSKRAKTLFATHYSELTEMENEVLGAKNFSVAVHESQEGIVFLRKIIPGGTDKSYGIHVAKLAGLPDSVIKGAEEMLIKLHASAALTKQSPLILKEESKQATQSEKLVKPKKNGDSQFVLF